MLMTESEIFCMYMYWFTAGQQTGTAKLPTFFSRFQTKERFVSVVKSKITGEKKFNGNHLGNKSNQRLSKDRKKLFGYFCKFVTRAFTLRPQKSHFYVFRT